MSKISDAQMGISTAGGAAAIGLSFIPGVGPAVGAAAGGVTSMINAILGLADTPSAPKVPAAERQAAGVGAQALAGLAGESGLNAQQVSYIGQVGRERQITDSITTSTLAQGLSPYDKKRLFDKLKENSISANQGVADTIQRLDPLAEAQRYSNVIQGSATVAGSYGAINQQETTAQLLTQEYKKAAATSFASSMTKIAKNIGGIFNASDQNQAATAELKKLGIANPTAGQSAAYAGVMARESGTIASPMDSVREDLLKNADASLANKQGKLTKNADASLANKQGKLTDAQLSASFRDAMGDKYSPLMESAKVRIANAYTASGRKAPDDAELTRLAEQTLMKRYVVSIQRGTTPKELELY